MDIPLKCACGAFQGKLTDVSRAYNKRAVCLCNDCQAFAHYLGQPDKVLDRNGGTEVVPAHPARIKITRGAEKMTCVRLSDDGMIRWYTSCCKTPIANTMTSPKAPFAGMLHNIFDFSNDSKQREEKLGPIQWRVNGKYGIGPLPPGTSRNASPGIILNTLRFLAVGIAKGLSRPSPFFDSKTGKPTVEPLVLSDTDYYKLIEKCGPKAQPQVASN